ncbi:hypothetical protein [Bacillus pseudomycoides]|nr:hypothetical protein [Bacillus pseudomycoides]
MELQLDKNWFNEMLDKDNSVLDTYREILQLIEFIKSNQGNLE